MAEFVAELRRLSEHCKFGTNLDEIICDRYVCGILDARVQHRLPAKPDLTFKKIFELVQSMEVAEHNFKNLLQRKQMSTYACWPRQGTASAWN